jgi:chaperone LolA
MPMVAVPADTAADQARVEEYLSGLTTIVADFSQTNTDGSLASGKFYLKRPGKMRWDYAPPTPIQLVSDGKTVTYYDSELKQVSYISVDDTLAGFLAQSTITLESKTTHLTSFESTPGAIRATLIQKAHPDEGSLTLEFSDKPLQLRQMTVADATGHITHVSLQNAQFGVPIDDALFVFKNPGGVVSHKRHQEK